MDIYENPEHSVTQVVIPAHVFIVENTGWSKERVEGDMKNIITIFSKHGVMFSLKIKYTFLLDDTEHEDFRDFIYSDYYQSSQGRDYFFDKDKIIFIYIFNESIRQSNYLAGHVPNTTTVVFTNRADNSTAAHETGHIMGLLDIIKEGNNLMEAWRSTNIDEIYLTPEQMRIANEYLQSRG